MSKQYEFQLYERLNGAMIIGSGGNCYVATAGDASKATLTDKTGASLTNPISLTNGKGEFYVANSVDTVDLYIMAPDGQFVVMKSVAPGTVPDIYVDTQQRNQVAVIPFSIDDTTAATETDTGFDLVTDAFVLGMGVGIDVLTADAAITVDAGILSGESGGDANGFIAALSVAAVGFIKTTLADGAATLGVLLSVDESAGDLIPEGHRIDGTAISISYTILTAGDTAEGFLLIPYILGSA